MNKELDTLPTLERPTRVRFGVLGFACSLSMITYLDRVCFGTIAPTIQSEFGLTDAQKGMLFSAFALAYAVFEVPTGWLGDVYGPRKTLIRIVLWWSVFTALTGMIYPIASVPSFAFIAMLTVRFFFGVGEAGAYPNLAKALHNWLPFGERGFGQGMVWMAGRFAGGITALVVLALLQHVEWRHAFWVFGVLGVIWCVLFWVWFRDRPEQKASVNEAELAIIASGQAPEADHSSVPWKAILSNRNLWVLCAMYFCASYGWYFNITWLPGYLTNRYGIDQNSSGFWTFSFMAGAPLLFGSLACIVGGLMTDAFIRRTGNRKWGRRLFGVVGHGTCAICYFLSLLAPNPWLFVLAVAMASFCNDLTMGSAWASCLDIGKRYSGIVAGCMNTVGNLGGAAAGYFTGLILSAYTGPAKVNGTLLAVMNNLGGAAMAPASGGNAIGALDYGAAAKVDLVQAMQPGWTVNFLMYGGVYVVALFLWLNFDSTKPIVTDHE